MAATITKGQTFGATELVTNTKLHNLVDSATISGIAVSELADGTDGQLITWDAAGAPAVVATGTATHVLTSNGAGAAPTFQENLSGNVTKVGTPLDSQVGVWTGDGTIEGAASFTYDGSNLQITGDIGSTGTKITKGWFTDLMSTNAIAGDITGNAATVTNATLTTALTVNTGTLTLTADAGNDSVLTIGGGAVSVSGTNTGDNAANSSSTYIGTTAVALNRASAALTLAGITLTTPDIGTPSAGTLTNCTGLPMAGVLAGTLATGTALPNGAGGTTVDATGEICVDSTSKTLNFYDGTAEVVLNPELSKSITVEDPADDEDISMFYLDDASTIHQIEAVLVGSDTPSVTWTIRHGTDRSAAGAEVVTGGTTTTSVSTGSVVTSFNDATIVADSFVWLETTAQSGTVGQINITIRYRQDA